MKLAAAFLLACAALAGQTLDRTLAAMQDAKASSATLSAQLIDEMARMAPADRRPTRGTLAGFANEFTAALMGKDLTRLQRTTLQLAITDLVAGSGANYKPAGILREVLEAAGVGASRTQRIVTSFIAIGEEIRGPDDIHILPVRAK